MRTGEIAVEGGRLAFDEAGEGPPIVFLHGFSFDRSMWAPQLAGLAASHRTIAYDLRGFGASSRPDGPYSHVRDLTRVLDRLRLESPLLVGLSLGANVVLEWVERNPERGSGMVLASPGLPGYRWRGERPPDAIRETAVADGVAAARERWMAHPIYATLRSRPAADAAFRAMLSGYDGWHWANHDPRDEPPDLAALLPGIATRALVLSGAQDDPGYREIARIIAGTLPHARLDLFDGCGHLLNLEEPERFNGAVAHFAQGTALADRREYAPTAMLPPPALDLEEPGTFLFRGRDSTRGLRLNRFGLSLKQAANRERFLADGRAYMEGAGLSTKEQRLVVDRDWTGLLRAGCHLQAALKVAATVGEDLFRIGAHNVGTDVATLRASCPRRIVMSEEADG